MVEKYRSRTALGLLLVVLGGLAAGCGPDSARDSRRSGASSTPTSIHVVALGDSDATGIGDSSGRGWVGRYADLLHQARKAKVAVDNRAREGLTSAQLIGAIKTDHELQAGIAKADVVLIGLGGADLNPGDDALSLRSCRGHACYRGILKQFETNLAQIVDAAHELAPSALLRAMSLPNSYPGGGEVIPSFITADVSRFQATAERDIVCRVLEQAGGRCADVVRAFNGAAANGDAYQKGLMTKDPCCYPSDEGQQLIARLLVDTGVDGLP
jgi:lysophospholipase L1-like esterase